jgi:hypothetical protein
MRYDIIAFLLISLFAIALGAYSVYMFRKSKKLLTTIVELHIQRAALEDLINNQALNKEENVEQSDGFIKFLSESREWEFDYIDNVQQLIFVLKEKYDNKKALDEELKKLFDMLPENNKEK